VDLEREEDVEHLRRVALALQVANQHLADALARKCKELEQLKGDPTELQRTLALVEAATGEAQAALAGTPSTEKAKTDKTKARERVTTGPTPQPRLPLGERVYTLDDADRACPSCGGGLAPMAGQFETSELIDVVQVEYKLVQVKQQKYVCRCGGCVETALGPARASAGSRYSLDLAIKVVLDKYLDHLPLARQVRIMERLGLDITSQTLWDLTAAVAKRLAGVDAALLEYVLAQAVMGLDQTGWPRLDSGGGKPWQMWCLTAPGVVVHRICHDKSAATFVDLVGAYEGTIVCDALATHAAGAREGPGITLAGCWAHVIRKFREAAVDHPDAQRAVDWIGALYAIDERAGDDPEQRGALRLAEAPAVLAELKTWLWNLAALKTTSIGNAAAYTIGNWDRLTRFVDEPRIPLDNNATERGIRGPVVGRRNHFGSKSRQGTAVAATLYSLVETAKLHDVDPAHYLREAILAADRGEVLLPWQLTRPTSA
jgi:transposase